MTATLDVQRLILPEVPPQWGALPRVVIDALHAGGGTLWHHRDCVARRHGPRLAYDCAAACPVQVAEGVLANRWYLIENDAVPGFRPECGICGRKHRFLSLACLDKPFNGLTEIFAILRQPRIEGRDRITEGFRFGALVPITSREALVLRERIRGKIGWFK